MLRVLPLVGLALLMPLAVADSEMFLDENNTLRCRVGADVPLVGVGVLCSPIYETFIFYEAPAPGGTYTAVVSWDSNDAQTVQLHVLLETCNQPGCIDGSDGELTSFCLTDGVCNGDVRHANVINKMEITGTSPIVLHVPSGGEDRVELAISLDGPVHAFVSQPLHYTLSYDN